MPWCNKPNQEGRRWESLGLRHDCSPVLLTESSTCAPPPPTPLCSSPKATSLTTTQPPPLQSLLRRTALFEGWVINVPSDTPSGRGGSPGDTETHIFSLSLSIAHTRARARAKPATRTGDPSNGVNWPSVAVSCVSAHDGDPEVTPQRPSCAIITIPFSNLELDGP